MESDEVTFPLPEAKYSGDISSEQVYYVHKRCTTCYILLLAKSACQHTTSTVQRSFICCEHCQNFEAVIHEMAKYMIGIPCTLADCVDSSMCPYNSYFPKMDCVLRIVKTVSHKN